jgi:hypothetical protein
MENIITIALLATLMYCILKFIEMKVLPKEEIRPLKYFVREITMVFASTVVAALMYFSMSYNIADFMNVMTETKAINSSVTQIFTDTPGF